jgi:hypothetical protein
LINLVNAYILVHKTKEPATWVTGS